MTFIDTPGHAAFSKMRLRGTQVADIVVLVIAADAGIQDQTLEVIKNIQETDVPFVVAINKCDLDNADPEKIIEELSTHGIIVEDRGGDVQSVQISAKTGMGVDKLIEALQMQSEFDNDHLFVDEKATAEAYILDVFKEKGLGVSATALVYTGTLKTGNVFVCGTTWGKVKSIHNRAGESLKEGKPSVPLNIVGFKGDIPSPGDELIVVPKEKFAQEVVNYRKKILSTVGQDEMIKEREQTFKQETEELLNAAKTKDLDEIRELLDERRQAKHFVEQDDTDKTINVIIKADVPGSIEGLESALSEIPAEEYGFSIRILTAKIGPVSETDVETARDTNAYLVSFNQKVPHPVQVFARSLNQSVNKVNIIYTVVDEVAAILESKLPKSEKHITVGQAKVNAVFTLNKHKKKKKKNIAGCSVTDGTITRSSKVLGNIIRDGEVIFTGPVESLQHHKDAVNEVKKGQECGIRIAEFEDYLENDVIELFETQLVPTKLNWNSLGN